jgi:hypothetical protein
MPTSHWDLPPSHIHGLTEHHRVWPHGGAQQERRSRPFMAAAEKQLPHAGTIMHRPHTKNYEQQDGRLAQQPQWSGIRPCDGGRACHEDRRNVRCSL